MVCCPSRSARAAALLSVVCDRLITNGSRSGDLDLQRPGAAHRARACPSQGSPPLNRCARACPSQGVQVSMRLAGDRPPHYGRGTVRCPSHRARAAALLSVVCDRLITNRSRSGDLDLQRPGAARSARACLSQGSPPLNRSARACPSHAFRCLKQDGQDLQDGQDEGGSGAPAAAETGHGAFGKRLWLQDLFRSVRTLMSIEKRLSPIFKVR